jgi:hypothetical protein
MRFELLPHPVTIPDRPFTLWASAERSADFGATATLNLWFGVGAPAARFRVPDAESDPSRRDGLWQSTCFELFLKVPGQEAYREWNFSPSGDWAAYDFTTERTGMSPSEIANPPYIRVEDNLTWWGVGATISVPSDLHLVAAISAVLEDAEGRRTYWALHHPRPEPDFHHPGCFTARLN